MQTIRAQKKLKQVHLFLCSEHDISMSITNRRLPCVIIRFELVALLNLSSWCLVIVEPLFLAVPWGCLRFVIVVFPDHTHLLFLVLTIE